VIRNTRCRTRFARSSPGALNLAYLITGVVVVEIVFVYPGLGQLMVDSVSKRDIPVCRRWLIFRGLCAQNLLPTCFDSVQSTADPPSGGAMTVLLTLKIAVVLPWHSGSAGSSALAVAVTRGGTQVLRTAPVTASFGCW
jgi:hypothetical protein